jgi:hypothetical protein
VKPRVINEFEEYHYSKKNLRLFQNEILGLFYCGFGLGDCLKLIS